MSSSSSKAQADADLMELLLRAAWSHGGLLHSLLRPAYLDPGFLAQAVQRCVGLGTCMGNRRETMGLGGMHTDLVDKCLAQRLALAYLSCLQHLGKLREDLCSWMKARHFPAGLHQ